MSKFLKHCACTKCGSSDANSVFDDGHEYCFSCGVNIPAAMGSGFEDMANDMPWIDDIPVKGDKTNTVAVFAMPSVAYQPITDRRITKQTAQHYGVIVNDGKHYYPYKDASGQVVAAKIRTVATKTFATQGAWSSAGLFGQTTFTKGGKYVTITEGELDALATYQMSGSQWPVVSIRNGAKSAVKDCKAAYEWLDSFDNIVICFDGDEPGIAAAKEVGELFQGKAKIFLHPNGCKDACDYLVAGKEAEFLKHWWKAETQKPEGVVNVADIKERLLMPPVKGIDWCFPTLTKLTYGRRYGELYGFGAGVGVGKTDVFTQQIAYDIQTLGIKVGVIYLEQNVVETAQRVMGKIDQCLYHIPSAGWSREEYVDSVDKLTQREQLYMMEHFGSLSWESVKSTIRYFAKAYDIKMIYLDHLTALSANEVDERRALDGIMADMASLAQSLGIIIHFVSHLTTPEGKQSHEEGARVMEKQFTGSRAIARWSNLMIGLERDKQHADIIERQTTTVRILKDRYTGAATGETFKLRYNTATGTLSELYAESL